MTINGIWEWATTHSKKLEIDKLYNKTLAIDGHIWLYESARGCQNHHQSGSSVLVTFFKRCRRLMEQRIRPIVVFDSILADQPSTSASNQEQFSSRKIRRIGTGEGFTNFADQVFKCQVMLRHLGVSVIVSSGDGEAQCAQLEIAGITQGCISTDFDYFLFGGRNLYRMNFDNSGNFVKDAVHIAMETLEMERKIFRNGLISLAILLGCDYYEKGVNGIGIVTGLEVLNEFASPMMQDGEEDDPTVILDRFTSYVRGEIPERPDDSPRKLKLRKRSYYFTTGFPNTETVSTAVETYLRPKVQLHGENTISKPLPIDIDRVEAILMKECGWSPERMKKELRISEKRLSNVNEKVNQTHIPDYFLISRKKRYAPVIEKCSLDEYIEANKKWIEDKKRLSSESPEAKNNNNNNMIRQKVNLKNRKARKRPFALTSTRNSPIDLADSSDDDEEQKFEVITIDD